MSNNVNTNLIEDAYDMAQRIGSKYFIGRVEELTNERDLEGLYDLMAIMRSEENIEESIRNRIFALQAHITPEGIYDLEQYLAKSDYEGAAAYLGVLESVYAEDLV